MVLVQCGCKVQAGGNAYSSGVCALPIRDNRVRAGSPLDGRLPRTVYIIVRHPALPHIG